MSVVVQGFGNVGATVALEANARGAHVIGVSDHLASEIPELIRFVEQGALKLEGAVTRVVPLAALAINGVLDDLEAFRDDVRTVVQP